MSSLHNTLTIRRADRFQDPDTKMWQQGFYDDARSVAMKYALATSGSVSGLFIWPLNGNSVSSAAWAWGTLIKSVGLRKELMIKGV
eukprot:SAG11_NODE_3154_length_2644_cov_3.422004_4_plen_86_part_00